MATAPLASDDPALKRRRAETVGAGVHLTEWESRLCQLLLRVVRERQLKTTLRIAGGWVRDKLLGHESEDIDIALDDHMGAAFVEVVNDVLTADGMAASHVGIIKRNPDQSKHLETATVLLLDRWVDFVNLRSESYETDSRIPDKIGFGTPEEDALRRDITINALFYNINTGQVEDLTGQGLDDMRNGVIRTPTEPQRTFLDDPLRMLRVIRFAARFAFRIDPVTYRGLLDAQCQVALQTKVSRERIGIEVDKMLKVIDTGLFDIVFQGPEEAAIPVSQAGLASTGRALGRAWRAAEYGLRLYTLLSQPMVSMLAPLPDDVRSLYLAAMLAPDADRTGVDKRKKVHPYAALVVRDHLKGKRLSDGRRLLGWAAGCKQLPNKDIATVTMLHACARQWQSLPPSAECVSRSALGHLLRDAGPQWALSLILAAVTQEIPSASLEGPDALPMETDGDDAIDLVWDPQAVWPRMAAYAAQIQRLGLLGIWDERPLLDGKEVGQMLGLKPGPEIGRVLAQLLEWQLDHPGSTEAEARAFVLARAPLTPKDEGSA